MTTLDTANGIDFWHANEYLTTTSSSSWSTQIGKFNFTRRRPNADGDANSYTYAVQLVGGSEHAYSVGQIGGGFLPG